jgi:hypothetical protein
MEYENVVVCIHPPDNPRMRGYNRGHLLMKEKPYLERNLDIIENADMLIACPVDKNREEVRSGTWSTIRHARKRGIKVVVM